MNIYIATWQNTINMILWGKEQLKRDYTVQEKSNDVRELASKQLKLLDDMRPDKEKSCYSQCNILQKEFIDYLEQVIIYGNLEAKDNVNIRNSII